MEKPKHIVQQMRPKIETKPSALKKNWWIAVSLIGIFLLVLFFNTYFNLTSEVSINPEGKGLDKFYLSGPDPYYNMRLVEGTYETGRYPYYSEPDPLLRYPIGARGGRAPLFNMMAIGFSRFLTPFMNEIDALGYSMQFIPALFGALLIFPVYFIGKELFNKKAGIIGAMFIAIIPIHLGSGHGSAYALFDHDSFNLLLFFLTFLFLIKSLKEKDSTKSVLYALLAGVPLAALTMTWVEAQYLYVIIAIYAVVQMFVDIFTDKIELPVFRTTSVVLFSGYLISLPIIVSLGGISLNTPLFLCIAITAFGVVYYIFGRKKIPWTLSLPAIFSIGAIALVFLYFIEDLAASFPFLSPLRKLSEVIFGAGIYGSKVSMTIAEANTYQISHTVMSFGPSLYWLAWGGFLLLLYHYYKNKQRKEYLFIIMLFVVNIWLAGTAGRFLNDMVPLIAILGGWIVWMFVDLVDYRQMLRNIRSAGGGIHGIRRGIKFLHVFGILFIAFVVILPSTFVAFDAAVPNTGKLKDDGESWTTLKAYMYGDDKYRGAFGLGVGKERYWADAFNWLSEQDKHVEDPTQRPAFISWWDYGFYEVALGDHPTVADNFQDGIPTAANFHTSTSEKEAVVVLSIRLLEGNRYFNNGKFTDDVVQVLENHLGENNTVKVTGWIENPWSAPSHGKPIGAEYDVETSKEYRVGQQYSENAFYHDIVELLTNEFIDPETNETISLTDEEITWLYHDLQEATGYSIRYYGVEGYDRQIFNIFGFLSDKSLLLVNGIADDFIELVYQGYTVDSQGEIDERDKTWSAKEIMDMSREARRFVVVQRTNQIYKDPYFETMFYKTYIGPAKELEDGSKAEFDYQIPCIDMKHFYAEYISDLSKYPYSNTGKGAVVIAKYYEGAYVNVTVTFNGDPVNAEVAAVSNLTYYGDLTIPIDHDKETTTNGNFSLIIGAGARLQIRRIYSEEMQIRPFILKNVTFDGETGSETAPITDDDAMRKGTNYERILNISIEPATVGGYIYIDNDDDGSYNKSVDTPLQNVNVSVYDISYILPAATNITNESGFYNASDLLPGFYLIRAEQNGFVIRDQLAELFEFNNYQDLSQMKHSAIEGKVFFEDESNTISDASVKLTYRRKDPAGNIEEEILVNSTTTGANGEFNFSKTLVSGEYELNVTKGNEFRKAEQITLNENETLVHNVLLEFTPVTVTGAATYNGIAVGEVDISFSPDESVENNTAIEQTVTSGEDGLYEIDLSPGSYRVTVEDYEIVEEERERILVYSFYDKLNVSVGEISKSYDISLSKNSATVRGYTSFEGTNKANVTNIKFEPNISVVNYSAIYSRTVQSNETGQYSLELSPGSYIVTVNHSFSENGQNYTYTFNGTLTIEEKDIELGITYNIAMAKSETE